jgi:cytochrome c oxidase cbb3-type subunit 2
VRRAGRPRDGAAALAKALRSAVALRLAVVLGPALLIGAGLSARAEDATPLTLPETQGKAVYAKYCVGCHGEKGDGNGPAAPMLDPRPRNFTLGAFKFRTTPTGNPPTEEDLLRTLGQGVHGTSMPSWRLVPEDDRRSVIEYLKTFSAVWKQPRQPAFAIPDPPVYVGSDSSVARGRELYTKAGCFQCHGPAGKGDGPASANLTDVSGFKIKPFDFTRGTPKGGSRPQDFYRAFTAGLDGTPMPSYAAAGLSEESRWHLVSYVLWLRSPANPER